MGNGKPQRGKGESARRNRRELLRLGACAGAGMVLGAGGLSCCPWGSKKSERSASMTAEGLPRDWTLIAYCCLECDKCDVYIATQKNDNKLRAKVAEEWHMDAKTLYCDGCKSDRALFNCEARQCASFRGLASCAHCDYFDVCDKEVWTQWPQLKEKVETMREKLRLS